MHLIFIESFSFFPHFLFLFFQRFYLDFFRDFSLSSSFQWWIFHGFFPMVYWVFLKFFPGFFGFLKFSWFSKFLLVFQKFTWTFLQFSSWVDFLKISFKSGSFLHFSSPFSSGNLLENENLFRDVRETGNFNKFWSKFTTIPIPPTTTKSNRSPSRLHVSSLQPKNNKNSEKVWEKKWNRK